MVSPISQAIKQICEEKNLTFDSVVETIEAALAAAYRKDFGNKLQNIKVEFDPESARIRVYDVKEVVENIDLEAEEKKREEIEKKKEQGEDVAAEEEDLAKFNPKTQVMISDAKDIKADAKIAEEIRVELEVPGEFGRMAAQTAKQVITQKLREAERQTIFDEFKGREGEILNAVIQRREGRVILVDLGQATGIIRPEDQIESERYRPGERIKVYLSSVEMTTKGPAILLSRTHPEVVRRLFELEIPEIAAGTVEIKAIAREAGSRSKVAVFTSQENVDPIGSCIGQRGTRIQTIIGELGGEKIDIIEWDEDAGVFIMNALSPAKVIRVELNQKEKSALATVAPDQLSLAIGKGGQNVRLAAKLTAWKINVAEEKTGKVVADSEQGGIVKADEDKEAPAEAKAEEKPEPAPVEEKEEKKEEKPAQGGSAPGGKEEKEEKKEDKKEEKKEKAEQKKKEKEEKKAAKEEKKKDKKTKKETAKKEDKEEDKTEEEKK